MICSFWTHDTESRCYVCKACLLTDLLVDLAKPRGQNSKPVALCGWDDCDQDATPYCPDHAREASDPCGVFHEALKRGIDLELPGEVRVLMRSFDLARQLTGSQAERAIPSMKSLGCVDSTVDVKTSADCAGGFSHHSPASNLVVVRSILQQLQKLFSEKSCGACEWYGTDGPSRSCESSRSPHANEQTPTHFSCNEFEPRAGPARR